LALELRNQPLLVVCTRIQHPGQPALSEQIEATRRVSTRRQAEAFEKQHDRDHGGSSSTQTCNLGLKGCASARVHSGARNRGWHTGHIT
jgi:hypothetical protein